MFIQSNFFDYHDEKVILINVNIFLIINNYAIKSWAVVLSEDFNFIFFFLLLFINERTYIRLDRNLLNKFID